MIRSPEGGAQDGVGCSAQAAAPSASATETAPATADRRRYRGTRRSAIAKTATVRIRPTATGERSSAAGQPETTRATSAIHAAHQPASHANAAAAPGKTGSIAAAASASPMSGGIAGSAATLAGTVQSASAPKWSQTIGAVTTPQATATTVTSQSRRGTG